MKHESISQNLYSEHNKFHTEICVFTVSDAHIQCAYQRDRQTNRERERVCVCEYVCVSLCVYDASTVYLSSY